MQTKKRKSTRLQNYDYSSEGLYFITICTKDRIECLGQIENNEMILNDLGKIIEKYLDAIENYFDNVFLDTDVIMPNHLHFIIEIINNHGVGAEHAPPLRDELSYQTRRKMLIPKIIGKLKMMSAKEINIFTKNSVNSFWQRNYYDHIIRNENELNRIRE